MAAQEKQLFEIPSDEEAKLAADSSRILDTGKLAFHKSGTRRKILYKDLLTYKTQDLKERKALMAELAKHAQE